MASSNSWSPLRFFSSRTLAPGLATLLGLAITGVSPEANAEDPMMPASTAPVIIDARRSLPLFPANSWKDGFYVEHSAVADLGAHIRVTGVYGRNPLGRDEIAEDIVNRFTLHLAALASIAKWVDVGAAMPFVLYQDGRGLNLNKTAIGDLRLLGKLRFPIPDKIPIQVALSVGVGFATAGDNTAIGAGGVSGYPKLIVDFPSLFGKRLHIAANFGAVIGGTTRPCTADELAMEASSMTMLSCEKRQLGLGNHLLYGVGISANLSKDQGLYATTELLGSFPITELATKVPLFWTIGLRRAKANSTFFSAMYGYGLTDASPGHQVLISLGLVWETKPPEKKKEAPTVKVEINLTGLPTGANVTAAGKGDPKSATAGGPKKEGGAPGGEKKEGGGAPAPAKEGAPKKESKPVTLETEVELPEGLVPEEGKGKAPGGGEKKGK